MIIYPAIDIRGGKCVRLEEGRFDRETVFAEDPVDAARRWVEAGTDWLHIVDLDGARAGHPVNLAKVQEIAMAFPVRVQLGGGIRTIEAIREVLGSGISRVILGSVAVSDPQLVQQACDEFGDRIAVGIDARGDEVAVSGWEKPGRIGVQALAVQMRDAGVRRIIFTDIGRDGMLTGVNITATLSLAAIGGFSVIASGGVKGIEDVIALQKTAHEGIDGVIIGKALYTGAVDLKLALQAALAGDI